ncbi:MAG: hypothetical protein ACI8W3_000536 [Myxococcota bacterium]
MVSKDQKQFKTNLRELRRKNHQMAEDVMAAGTESCEIIVGRSGETTVVQNGIQLASAYNPKKEGETIANEIVSAEPDIVVAIGFGLGHHIEAVRAKSSALIIVYEPSAERMRAVLTARSGFTFLADKHLDFASNTQHLNLLLQSRYVPGLKLQVYVHPATFRIAPDEVRDAVKQVSRSKDYVDISVGTRVRDLKSWGDITMQNAGFIMKSPSFRELFGRFKNVPAVVVSAGPSLDKQLPLLKKYRDRLLIIAIGQSLGALRSAGIEPDLVHILESKHVTHQLTRIGTSDNVNLVVTNDVTPGIFHAPVRSRFIATPGGDKVGRWIAGVLGRDGWVFGGSTVAHGAVSLGAALGANPIMLVGQDLAYTDGRHYAKGSAYDQVEITIDDDGFSTIDSSSRAEMLGFGKGRAPKRMRVVWVDGWHGEEVATSPAYAGFIDGYRELAIACRQVGTEVINCTEGGAYIPTLDHAPLAESLERHTEALVDARQIIHEQYDNWEAPDPSVFDGEIRRVKQLLSKLERLAAKGVRRCEATSRELPRSHSPQRKIDLLRQLARLEKDLRSMLVSVEWIDSVVQPELSASQTEIRRSQNLQPTPEQAVKEAEFLFKATRTGVERARELLEYCAESVGGRRWPYLPKAAAWEEAAKEAIATSSAPRGPLLNTAAPTLGA